MPTAPNILSTLRRVPFLADLDPSDLEVLSERMARRPFLRGQTIFVEGDRSDGLYLVESGTVRVVKTSQQGREQLLSLERVGGALCEIALLDGGPHPASAIADSDGAMLILPAPDLRALMQSHPQVALAMIKAVTRRFRRVLRLVEELSFSTGESGWRRTLWNLRASGAARSRMESNLSCGSATRNSPRALEPCGSWCRAHWAACMARACFECKGAKLPSLI